MIVVINSARRNSKIDNVGAVSNVEEVYIDPATKDLVIDSSTKKVTYNTKYLHDMKVFTDNGILILETKMS